MKKLDGTYLSIGAGDNQLPLILAAKARGLKVISVDQNAKAVGFAHSDIKILESTHEYRKILHAMSQVPLAGKLLGIGTRSFGKACYTVAYLNSKFKLKGNPPEIISSFLNKEKIKSIISQTGISLPKSIHLNLKSKSTSKTNFEFPLIAKPKTGSAKMGIQILETEADLKKFSKQKGANEFLIERLISGDEVTVLGFVISRKFYLISITDKITTGAPEFIEIAHIAPSRYLHMAGELKMLCQVIVNKSLLKSGPFVAEFKINSLFECFLMESTPEIGGEYLADVLLPYHYGYNYFNDYVSVTIGEKTRPEFLRKTDPLKKVSALIFNLPKSTKRKLDANPKLQSNIGETIFFEKTLASDEPKVEGLAGNHRRTHVIGVSTRNEVDPLQWVEQVRDRWLS